VKKAGGGALADAIWEIMSARTLASAQKRLRGGVPEVEVKERGIGKRGMVSFKPGRIIESPAGPLVYAPAQCEGG